MDYNATTPLEPAVIQAMTEAMTEAWGNPSSSYPAGMAGSPDSGTRGLLGKVPPGVSCKCGTGTAGHSFNLCTWRF